MDKQHPNRSKSFRFKSYDVAVNHCFFRDDLDGVTVTVHLSGFGRPVRWLGSEAIDLSKERFWVDESDPFHATARECLSRLFRRLDIGVASELKILNRFDKEYGDLGG